MRNLMTADVFSFVRFVNKAGIKEEIKKAVESAPEGASVDSVGIDILWAVFSAVADDPKSEALLYDFLAGPLEMKASAVKTMSPIELLEALQKVAEVEKWFDFFRLSGNFQKK